MKYLSKLKTLQIICEIVKNKQFMIANMTRLNKQVINKWLSENTKLITSPYLSKESNLSCKASMEARIRI